MSNLHRWAVLLLALHTCVVAAQDSDRDGITDENEVVLGTDSSYPEPLTLLCHDKAKGQGDKSVGPDLSPCRDFTHIYFAPVAKGRYLWRIDFVEPFEPKPKNFCLLYIDVDNDRATGRQDKGFARGVDAMFDPLSLRLIDRPGHPTPGWASVVQGRSVYLVADLPLNQKDGQSVYRLYLLCCSHEKGKERDTDTSPWLDVVAPGESARVAKPWAFSQNENVVNWHMTRRGVRDLARDPANRAISPKACQLKGFAPEERVDEVSGGRYRGDALTFSCPQPGRYYVAWVMMNYGGRPQLHGLYVDGERKGFAICQEQGRGQQFFALTQPLAFTGREAVEIRVLRPGSSFRFRNILFLSKLPSKPPLRIAQLAGASVSRPGGSCRGRVTWITNYACTSEVHYGPTPAYGRSKACPDFINNHRAFLDGLSPGTTCHYRVVVRSDKDEVAEAKGKFVVATPAAPVGKVARGQVPLSVKTPNVAAQATVYVSSGVPFPAGHLASADAVRLLDQQGREVPVQTQALARWPDGTVKWLHLVFPVTVSAEALRLTLEYGTSVKSSPVKQQIHVQETAEGVEIVTGPLRLELSRGGFAPPGRVWLDLNADGQFKPEERMTQEAGESGVVLRDSDGKVFTSFAPPDEVVVEESGPLRVGVRIRGRHVAKDGSKLFTYTVRVYAYAGQSYVRLFYTFGNDQLQRMFTSVQGIDLTTGLSLDGPISCAFGGEAGRPVSAQDRIELYQDYENHFRAAAHGKTVAEGKRAGGWLTLSDGRRGTTVSVRNFWQLYPKALAARGNRVHVGLLPALAKDQYAKDKDLEDRLFYYLLNGEYKFRQGFEKRHELLYHFHVASELAYAHAVATAFQQPVVALAPPEWNCASAALGRMTPTRKDEFPWYERRLDASVERVFVGHRERFREYGMMNFGDWYGERGYNWGNMEYDTPFVLLAQGLRRGNPALFELGQQAARHNMDVDTVHYHSDPAYVGGVYAHCIGHTGWYYPSGFKPPATPRGGCSAGHMWNRGTFLYHFLTGDPRARDVAVQVSDHNAEYCTRNYTIANHASRDHSWPMLTCLTAYGVTHDPFYLNGARIIADKVIEGQDPATGCWLYPAGYSKVMPQKLGGYAWCVGLLINSLNWYWQHLDDPAEIDAAKTCMVRAADWLVTSEYMPQVQGFRSTSCPSFNPHTRPGSSTWSVTPGLVVVAKMTGKKKYLDTALAAYRHVLDRPDGMGKSFGINLCMTLHMLHDLKQMGITRFRDNLPPVKAHVPSRLLFAEQEAVRVPVYLASQSFAPIAGRVRVAALPAGWRAAEPVQAFALRDFGVGKELAFDIAQAAEPVIGQDYRVRMEVDVAQERQAVDVAIGFVRKVARGTSIGLIAGQDDYLGPALEKAGVPFKRIGNVSDDLRPYRVIFLGTQAHTLDAAGVSSRYWRLWRYVKEGGSLVVSQMNDDNWEPYFLPGDIRLGEDNSASGKIVQPNSTLFAAPHRLMSVAGALMYDHVRSVGPGWQTLVHDAEGRPAVMAGRFGHGRMLVFEPSFERFFTGKDVEATAAKPEFGRFFQNLLRYVLNA